MEKEYKVFEKSGRAKDTEARLNFLSMQGWRVICSYCGGSWLILERDVIRK